MKNSNQEPLIAFITGIIVTVLFFASSARAEASETVIKARIAPVGQVNVVKEDKANLTSNDDSTENAASIDTTASNSDKAPSTEKSSITKTASADSQGKTIYESKCVICHANGIAGAPKLGSKDQWKPRADEGMKVMMQRVKSGYKAMPPKGTCMECSDQDLKSAIEYMLSESHT